MKCGKVPYQSRAEAIKDIKYIYIKRRRQSNIRAKDGRKFRPYECHICKMWHLTTRRKRKYE